MVSGWWIGRRSAGAFARNRRGNVAMMWALMGAVLVGLIGITVDFTRAQALRAQLQNAADGAALVAERSSNLTLAERQAAAQAFFDAEMGDYAGDASMTVIALDSGGHRVEAHMPMPLSLARIIGTDDWDIRVDSEAEANASPPIEVVLALDNTGSMRNDMGTLRQGAEDLVNVLLTLDGDTVSVGIVPFVAQVNIGSYPNRMSWMDTAGTNPHHGEMLEDRYLGWRPTYQSACTNASRFPTTYGGFQVRWIRGPVVGISGSSNARCYAFSPSQVNMFDISDALPSSARWGGCVEARPEPYDISDDAPNPSTPATMFTPFFALDDGGDASANNNWITSNTYDRADVFGIGSDWTAASHVRSLAVYKYRSGVTVSLNTGNSTSARGPNRGCPTPIVPLTTNRTTAINAVRDMDYWYGGGTNQIEGLAWAWRVLSPGAPFTEGRPYDDPDDPVRKVIVLFTDGDNTSLNSSNGAFESEYSALSYRSLWRTYQLLTFPSVGLPGIALPWQRTILGLLGTSQDDDRVVEFMNARQLLLCNAIKARDIEIYTIGFRITANGTADQLLRTCATDASHYFHASNQSQLLEAFSAIGTGIGQLRLTH